MSLFSATGRSSFFGQWLGPRRHRKRNRHAHGLRFRLTVDPLESRTLLSTLTVTNTNNSGKGSLRYEVAQARANDLIQFASGLQGQTIKLTSGPITIKESLAIVGFENAQVTVSAGGKSQVFVVNTPSGAFTSIEGMTITGGVAPFGGAILNEGGGTLYLGSDVLTGNDAVGTAPGGIGQGGAVATTGAGTSLYVEQCVFSSNEALGANGAATSTTGNNVNGGDGDGGAIYNDAGTSFDIDGSVFLQNQAVGGSAGYNFGQEVAGGNGNGGAVDFDADNLSNAQITNTTFSDNQAVGGPGGRNEFGSGSYATGGASQLLSQRHGHADSHLVRLYVRFRIPRREDKTSSESTTKVASLKGVASTCLPRS